MTEKMLTLRKRWPGYTYNNNYNNFRMNTRELRMFLIVLILALLVTVHIQLLAVYYVYTDDNGK